MGTSQDKLIIIGVLGVAIATLVQLSSTSGIDCPLLVTSFALAIAVPTLTGTLLTLELGGTVWYLRCFFSVGLIAAWVALTGVFWHLHWIAGIVFAALSLLTFGFYMIYRHSLK
jgi:hypothetical protein